jgi:hypothetical protein
MIDKITWHAEELASQCGRIVYHILVNIHFSRHLILHSVSRKDYLRLFRVLFLMINYEISVSTWTRNWLTQNLDNPFSIWSVPQLQDRGSKFGSNICLPFQGRKSNVQFGTMFLSTLRKQGYVTWSSAGCPSSPVVCVLIVYLIHFKIL